MNIAVIGAGVSGLSCAWRLCGGRLDRGPGAVAGPAHRVTVYEANDYAGGHTHTVDAEVDGLRHPVDTGFLVFNRRTYPRLVELFAALDVETVASEMTFSVRLSGRGTPAIEWAGTDLNAVFAQRRNLVRPRFLRMLAHLLRFNRQATQWAARTVDPALQTWTLGEFLDAHGYSQAFQDWYLLPMAAAIWSCSPAQMRDFPLATFVRFCANHGLLQVVDRPQWFTVAGGAARYVERILEKLDDVRIATPALSVARVTIDGSPKVAVRSAGGTTIHDHVVLACHSDEALALLDDAGRDERAVLGAIRYQPNHAVLHTDAGVLPGRRRAWAAWNYQCRIGSDSGPDTPDDRAVCVHYLINKLQPVPFGRPVIVSLNPVDPIDPATILRTFEYAHPLFDGRAIQAQRRLPAIQGNGNLWFCGAWTGYGFHEDGLRSGLEVAEALLEATSTAQRATGARLAA